MKADSQYRYSSFRQSSFTISVKMASQFKGSLFLSPRPHIHGVGRCQPLLSSNIFMEFIKLSPLVNLLPEEYEPDAEEGTSKKKEMTYSTKVIDRDVDGNERLVSYNFNKNTLRMFDILESLNIPSETELYKPKEERTCVDPSIFYCKNLFLKDRKGQYFLVICHEDTVMDLKYLRKVLKAYRNFNFVTAEEMKVLLGTDPGGVTPLALMFANALDISMVISRTLYKEGASLMFHPLDSCLATKISLPSLLRFLKYVGHSVTIVD